MFQISSLFQISCAKVCFVKPDGRTDLFALVFVFPFHISWEKVFVVKPDGRADLFAFQITGGNNLSRRQTAYNLAFLRHLTFFPLFKLHSLYILHTLYFIFHHNWTRVSFFSVSLSQRLRLRGNCTLSTIACQSVIQLQNQGKKLPKLSENDLRAIFLRHPTKWKLTSYL